MRKQAGSEARQSSGWDAPSRQNGPSTEGFADGSPHPPPAPESAERTAADLRSAQIVAEFGFLFGLGLSADVILAADERAQALGVPTHTVLIAAGNVRPPDYVRAMATAWDLPVIGPAMAEGLRLRPSQTALTFAGNTTMPAAVQPLDAVFEMNGLSWFTLDGLGRRPRDLHAVQRQLVRDGVDVALTTPGLLRVVAERELRDQAVEAAAEGLAQQSPVHSAKTGFSRWQRLAAAVLPGVLAGSALVLKDWALVALFTALTLPFLAAALLRVAAVLLAPLPPRRLAGRDPLPGGLPVYTVLVPLFREARVLPGLVRALRALDYPPERLDIKLILEAVDTETIAAARSLGLQSPFEIIVVPDREPRTKPKALNYAMTFARGSMIAVFDAEDIPDPDQLRKAVAAFRAAPDRVGCLQGQLVIDNSDAGWLARQFSLEYLTLFSILLPALDRLRLPLPLGGTSNHFRADVLKAAGGWDAYNVTEDADLGIRLGRTGYSVSMLNTYTYEEAPVRVGAWLKQRTRWLKGFMQTWIVHMREPFRVWRDLGTWGFAGFHVVIGGVVLSALTLPLFLAGVALWALTGTLWAEPRNALEAALRWAAAFNLGVGFGATLVMNVAAIAKSRRWGLLFTLPLAPAYWLLGSIAAWRALWQMLDRPHLWEKTEHGLTRRRTARSRRLTSGKAKPLRRRK